MSTIILDDIYKHYHMYSNDYQRLKEVITGKSTADVIKALEPVSLKIEKSQVVGVIGNNGAGKSTLLKLISGTAAPSGGSMQVNGRIAALLELGTGFHPELTGYENIYLNGAILGISKSRMDTLYEEIVDFSGIKRFIDQPVKTYSSGMFIRLAFSVATSVDPDILIIDEALSVGDGNFARKSFDRIMKFKDSGKTILFCSHSMFHIESICDRAIWIDEGQIKMDGDPAIVVSAYNASMKKQVVKVEPVKIDPVRVDALPFGNKASNNAAEEKIDVVAEEQVTQEFGKKLEETAILASFIQVEVLNDGQAGKKLTIQSGESMLTIKAEFASESSIETPNFGITITDENDFHITSACTSFDDVSITRDHNGISKVELSFPKINLLKGKYFINAYLMCERCILTYEQILRMTELNVIQKTQELGTVRLAHHWHLVPTS